MREVAAIGRQPLDRGLARAQHALVVRVRADGVRILDDLVGELPVDRAAEPVHADSRLLSAPLPGRVRSSGGEYLASL